MASKKYPPMISLTLQDSDNIINVGGTIFPCGDQGKGEKDSMAKVSGGSANGGNITRNDKVDIYAHVYGGRYNYEYIGAPDTWDMSDQVGGGQGPSNSPQKLLQSEEEGGILVIAQ